MMGQKFKTKTAQNKVVKAGQKYAQLGTFYGSYIVFYILNKVELNESKK